MGALVRQKGPEGLGQTSLKTVVCKEHLSSSFSTFFYLRKFSVLGGDRAILLVSVRVAMFEKIFEIVKLDLLGFHFLLSVG